MVNGFSKEMGAAYNNDGSLFLHDLVLSVFCYWNLVLRTIFLCEFLPKSILCRIGTCWT